MPFRAPFPGLPLLLAAGLALAVLSTSPRAGAIWPFSASDDRPLQERAAEILSRAIRFRTVDSPEEERALARYLTGLADDMGLEARVVEVPANAGKTDGGASRWIGWARLAGNGRARPVVLLSHLDVVPADDSEWSVPPFEGRVSDGFVVGRGALDAKGIAVIQLLAMAELAKRDEPLDRDVILLATPDEETGGLRGAAHIARDAQELLGGAEYLLTEGGNIRAATKDAPSIWGVAVAEKSPCWLELTARAASGHSATPSPNAAVPRLVAALDAVRRIETPVRVVPEVQRMFRAMAAAASEQDRAGYRDLRKAIAKKRRFRRRFLSNPSRNALVRNTLSITTLEGAPRTNVAPAAATARIDARLLPGEECANFAHAIGNVVADESVEVATILEAESPSSPIDTDLYRTIERVAERDDPGALVVPRLTAGSTDARYFREMGIVSYGFVPRLLTPTETKGIHGANERVAQGTLEKATNTLIAILEELSASDQAGEHQAARE